VAIELTSPPTRTTTSLPISPPTSTPTGTLPAVPRHPPKVLRPVAQHRRRPFRQRQRATVDRPVLRPDPPPVLRHSADITTDQYSDQYSRYYSLPAVPRRIRRQSPTSCNIADHFRQRQRPPLNRPVSDQTPRPVSRHHRQPVLRPVRRHHHR
jgi:hypothetical protein